MLDPAAMEPDVATELETASIPVTADVYIPMLVMPVGGMEQLAIAELGIRIPLTTGSFTPFISSPKIP